MKNKREVCSELWDSLDMACVRKYLIKVLVVTGAALLLAVFPLLNLPREEMIQVCAVSAAVIILPVLLFCLWRTFRIFRKAESYTFSRCKLDSPKGGMLRDTIRFTVVVEDREGRSCAVDTHSIFVTHGMFGPLLEDYVNRTATIAYNEETGVVVVIG